MSKSTCNIYIYIYTYYLCICIYTRLLYICCYSNPHSHNHQLRETSRHLFFRGEKTHSLIHLDHTADETAVGSKSPWPLGKSSSQKKTQEISQKAKVVPGLLNHTPRTLWPQFEVKKSLRRTTALRESHIHPNCGWPRLPTAHAKVAPVVEWPVGTPIKATAHSKAETKLSNLDLEALWKAGSCFFIANTKHFDGAKNQIFYMYITHIYMYTVEMRWKKLNHKGFQALHDVGNPIKRQPKRFLKELPQKDSWLVGQF